MPVTSLDCIASFSNKLCQFALKTSGLAPNVILVDEAGQVSLVRRICAGRIGAGSVLLFGDDAQMPPVFSADIEDDPLAVSLFRRLRDTHPESLAMLDVTYRLNEKLCDVISKSFYADAQTPRRSSPQAAGRKLALNLNEASIHPEVLAALNRAEPFTWVQTPGNHARQVNPVEAKFVADILAAAIQGGLATRDLAVVTPYRRQAALIRRQIQERLPPDAATPIVDTVERVQGLTVELAIVSFCTSDPEHAASLAGFLFSPNRLNVAISRATSKVIVVASPPIFDGVPNKYRHLIRQQRVSQALHAAVATQAAGARSDRSVALQKP